MEGDASLCVWDAASGDAAGNASMGKVLGCCKTAPGVHMSK